MCCYVFVKTLDGAASFNQQYDNYAHLNAVRSFIDTGVYAYDSLLSYPFAWYSVAAMVAGVGLGEVSVAVNALNFVIMALIWLAAMCALLCRLFPSQKSVILCGALCSVAFVEFPWGIAEFGPLYPNLLGYSVLPAVMAVYVSVIDPAFGKKTISKLFLLVVGLASLVFMHPNAVFVGIVFLVPYTVSHFLSCGLSLRARGIISIAFMAFVAGVWGSLYVGSVSWGCFV